jgi:hypothetical protein
VIYSVWNQAAGLYDYYEGPGVADRVNAPAPRHLRETKFGMTARQAAWPLPQGVRPVGSGAAARGRVAAAPGAALSGFFDPVGIVGAIITSPLLLAGVAAGVGYVIWRRR